jgi:hypothetical protein
MSDRAATGIREKGKGMKKLMMLAVMLAMVLAFGAPAMAEDHPCGDPYPHIGAGTFVQVCPLWRGHVPVYGDVEIAGYLESADGNWFVCQDYFPEAPYTVPGTDYTNDNWALTMADNGAWGWVPVAYFAGGTNYQPDDNLRSCYDYYLEQGAASGS